MARTRGFTLVELLIVISIIGVLTSVILSSMNTARATSRNAQRNSVVMQHKVAFELASDAYNAYPDSGGNYACLGVTGRCWIGSYSNSATVDSQLTGFIAPNAAPVTTGLVYDGLLYYRYSASSYVMLWFLEGTNRSCAPGTVYYADYNGYGQTYCRYDSGT